MTRGPLHILLTGAASGLGRGLALYFAARGHRLVLADRNLDGLRETVGLLGDAAGRASAHPLDVTSADQVRGLIAWPRSQRSPAEVTSRAWADALSAAAPSSPTVSRRPSGLRSARTRR